MNHSLLFEMKFSQTGLCAFSTSIKHIHEKMPRSHEAYLPPLGTLDYSIDFRTPAQVILGNRLAQA